MRRFHVLLGFTLSLTLAGAVLAGEGQYQQGTEQQTQAEDRANLSKSQGFVTVHSGDAKCKRIKCTGGSTDPGETVGLQVEVDDKSAGTLGTGHQADFKGKKIRIKALSRIVSFNLNDC